MALPAYATHARPSPRHHRLSPRTRTQDHCDQLKKFLAREHGIAWQRDFFDHRLRSSNEETEKREYILMNPVRKGCCERAEDWPWIYQPNDRPPPQLDYQGK